MPQQTGDFIKAIQHIGPSPCDNCSMYSECASKQLACDAYVNFQYGGKKWQKEPEHFEPKKPTAALFDKTFIKRVRPARVPLPENFLQRLPAIACETTTWTQVANLYGLQPHMLNLWRTKGFPGVLAPGEIDKIAERARCRKLH